MMRFKIKHIKSNNTIMEDEQPSEKIERVIIWLLFNDMWLRFLNIEESGCKIRH